METRRLSNTESAALLPNTLTDADYRLLDSATANEALAIVMSILTIDQKNTIISDNGGRVTLAEFIEYAAYAAGNK